MTGIKYLHSSILLKHMHTMVEFAYTVRFYTLNMTTLSDGQRTRAVISDVSNEWH